MQSEEYHISPPLTRKTHFIERQCFLSTPPYTNVLRVSTVIVKRSMQDVPTCTKSAGRLQHPDLDTSSIEELFSVEPWSTMPMHLVSLLEQQNTKAWNRFNYLLPICKYAIYFCTSCFRSEIYIILTIPPHSSYSNNTMTWMLNL